MISWIAFLYFCFFSLTLSQEKLSDAFAWQVQNISYSEHRINIWREEGIKSLKLIQNPHLCFAFWQNAEGEKRTKFIEEPSDCYASALETENKFEPMGIQTIHFSSIYHNRNKICHYYFDKNAKAILYRNYPNDGKNKTAKIHLKSLDYFTTFVEMQDFEPVLESIICEVESEANFDLTNATRKSFNFGIFQPSLSIIEESFQVMNQARNTLNQDKNELRKKIKDLPEHVVKRIDELILESGLPLEEMLFKQKIVFILDYSGSNLKFIKNNLKLIKFFEQLAETLGIELDIIAVSEFALTQRAFYEQTNRGVWRFGHKMSHYNYEAILDILRYTDRLGNSSLANYYDLKLLYDQTKQYNQFEIKDHDFAYYGQESIAKGLLENSYDEDTLVVYLGDGENGAVINLVHYEENKFPKIRAFSKEVAGGPVKVDQCFGHIKKFGWKGYSSGTPLPCMLNLIEVEKRIINQRVRSKILYIQVDDKDNGYFNHIRGKRDMLINANQITPLTPSKVAELKELIE